MTTTHQVDRVYRSNRFPAKPTVLVFVKNVDRMLSLTVTQANLAQVDSGKGQDIPGPSVYRPILVQARARSAKQFPKLSLSTIEQAMGGRDWANPAYFAAGTSFDQIDSERSGDSRFGSCRVCILGLARLD